jgi:hypothetical protein
VVKPQMDVQGRLASLRLQPWRRRRDLAWPASSAGLLGAAASGIAARSTTALSVPSVALACRWRPLDLAKAHGDEAAPRVMSKLDRCISMHVVELTERGARTTPIDLILSRLAEEYEARPLQGLRNLDGVDDVSSGARRSTTAMSGVSCSGSEASCSCGGRRSSGGRGVW